MALLLTVSGASVRWISDFYQSRAVPAADQRSQQVQELLESWDGDQQSWEDLARSLGELDYSLAVSRGDQVVFSSLNRFQEEMYRRLAQDASWPEEGTLTVQNEGLVMVGTTLGEYTLVAMPQPDTPPLLGRQRPQSEAMLLALFISGVVVMAVVVVLSLLFTRWQIKRIMRPVNALAQAARRVEEGDLTTPVDYQGQDEFSSVCAAFDHMQRHLLTEREKNAAYERARTDLVAGISHDLRTPLTSVKGYIKGMRDGVANTPEKREQYLDIAYRKACDMDKLLQRLFYFSKLETGNLPMFPVAADLGEFVAAFAQGVGMELAPSQGRVELDIQPGPHPVLLDEEQMVRVLTNLKENALRYAQARPLVLFLQVSRQGEWECLRFADNGVGVSPEQLPHLFEQFWRGDQARGSSRGEGSGLGLYIVKYIVQSHGGTIQAESDGGLAFRIALPRKEEKQDE